MKKYQLVATRKKANQWSKIPEDWRISADQFKTLTNVMDIPLSCGVLSETDVRITSDYDATALLEQVKARVWSVEQVVVSFCKRAAIAHQLVCAVISPFPEAL